MIQNDKYQRVQGIFKRVTVCFLLEASYFTKMNPLHTFFHHAET